MKAKIFGWQECGFVDYEKAYEMFGGCVITHPKILDFIHNNVDCSPKFFMKNHAVLGITAAICTWQGNGSKRYLAGDPMSAVGKPFYGFNQDEIILPIKPEIKIILPYRTKLLSSLHESTVLNVSFKLNSKRVVCLAKGLDEDGFSSKTKSRREKEVRDFIKAGGEIKTIADFTPEELAEIYETLFIIRRGKSAECPDLVNSLRCLPEFFFGHVLLLNGKPCAFQLISMAESREWICFDFANIVVDTAFPKLSLGTIIMWLNIKEAYLLSSSKNKQMRFSFGKSTAEYKNRWCTNHPVGRVF